MSSNTLSDDSSYTSKTFYSFNIEAETDYFNTITRRNLNEINETVDSVLKNIDSLNNCDSLHESQTQLLNSKKTNFEMAETYKLIEAENNKAIEEIQKLELKMENLNIKLEKAVSEQSRLQFDYIKAMGKKDESMELFQEAFKKYSYYYSFAIQKQEVDEKFFYLTISFILNEYVLPHPITFVFTKDVSTLLDVQSGDLMSDVVKNHLVERVKREEDYLILFCILRRLLFKRYSN